MAIKYSAATKRKIKAITEDGEAFGIVLDGSETAELIDTYYTQLEGKLDVEEAKPEIVLAGVPNQVPVKTQEMRVANKTVHFPVIHLAEVKGGIAAYNETGRRITHVHSTQEERNQLGKTVAKMNAERWGRERINFQ